MNTEQAREYFASKGLSYKDLDESKIYLLISLLSKELSEFTMSPHVYDEKGNLKINHKALKGKYTVNGLTHCFIEVQGPYFKNREAISFNQDGFIGFAGWADGVNVQPFINAFVKWVDMLVAVDKAIYA